MAAERETVSLSDGVPDASRANSIKDPSQSHKQRTGQKHLTAATSQQNESVEPGSTASAICTTSPEHLKKLFKVERTWSPEAAIGLPRAGNQAHAPPLELDVVTDKQSPRSPTFMPLNRQSELTADDRSDASLDQMDQTPEDTISSLKRLPGCLPHPTEDEPAAQPSTRRVNQAAARAAAVLEDCAPMPSRKRLKIAESSTTALERSPHSITAS